MKILHVSKKLAGALGGDAVVVTNLQKQQQKAGHKVTIVTAKCDEISDGAHVYKVGLKDTPARLDSITPRRLVSLVILSLAMFKILGKEKPNLIHTHSIDMAFFVSFAARFYNVPIIHTFHIVTFYDASQSLIRRKTELWLARSAGLRYATAPNSYDVAMLQSAGLHQTMLLPNGVDFSYWRLAAHARADDSFLFVTTGRLETQKGYEYLIQAVALLAKSYPEKFQVVMAGEGSCNATLQALAKKLQVEHLITFLGRKNQEEIRSLLKHADAAVFPSLYESTPIALLEAWAAGAAVIITPVGILHDASVDFDAAYIVPRKDEAALMQAMRHCMTNDETRLQKIQKGQKEAQKYTWPKIARTAETIYRDTLWQQST